MSIDTFFVRPGSKNNLIYKLCEDLENAKESILFTAYYLNNTSVIESLKASKAPIKRFIICDDNSNKNRQQFINNLQNIGLCSIIKNLGKKDKIVMHHKFIVIDKTILWYGSFNPSLSAPYDNFDSLIRFEGSEFNYLLEEFVTEFKLLFSWGLLSNTIDSNRIRYGETIFCSHCTEFYEAPPIEPKNIEDIIEHYMLEVSITNVSIVNLTNLSVPKEYNHIKVDSNYACRTINKIPNNIKTCNMCNQKNTGYLNKITYKFDTSITVNTSVDELSTSSYISPEKIIWVCSNCIHDYFANLIIGINQDFPSHPFFTVE